MEHCSKCTETHRCNKCKQKDKNLRKRYKISLNEFNYMAKLQNYECKICSEYIGYNGHVDHDHSTGIVRGLLCHQCNTGLGMFKDNPYSLHRAINYLRVI